MSSHLAFSPVPPPLPPCLPGLFVTVASHTTTSATPHPRSPMRARRGRWEGRVTRVKFSPPRVEHFRLAMDNEGRRRGGRRMNEVRGAMPSPVVTSTTTTKKKKTTTTKEQELVNDSSKPTPTPHSRAWKASVGGTRWSARPAGPFWMRKHWRCSWTSVFSFLFLFLRPFFPPRKSFAHR